MKNWKYIQVGNEELFLRPVQGEIEKEVFSVYTQTGKDKEKTKKALKSKHPNLDEQWLDKLLSKLVGNESIYKQEASLFGGLGEKAEKEIGNADTVSEYNAEIQRLTKKAEQLRRMGQGKSAMEIEKQIEKLGKELRELGNSKTGNETPEEMEVKYKGYTITYFPYQKKYMVRHPSEVSGLIQKHFTSVDEAKKAIDKKTVGNETKGERKFGKVMGEFEEGALKTPQGKTVTDPAQAKAIAYSEADKVDNLKRARNAMNKKVKNSSVREYKDSEGRIAQIDFNSDGTDADMSIYEDERMTRAVESKNFSTIRDAEQYVQSHGFRRVG